VRPYRTEDAETVIVALGSVLGTIKDVVDERREAGEKIGVLGITSFRPFPMLAIRGVLRHAQRVIILEKALAIGLGGIVSDNVRNALSGITLKGNTVIAGLGGRAITKVSLHKLFDEARADRLERLVFLDMDYDLVQREIERTKQKRRSGSAAENILRDVGVVAARPA